MIEFTSGYRQVNSLTRNYFPLVTREPTPEMYIDSASRNTSNDPAVIREQQLRREMSALLALSGVTILLVASFGKPHEVRQAHNAMRSRRMLGAISAASRLPYTVASAPL
jgi:hypothetical protein